jgi:hypothetical protein
MIDDIFRIPPGGAQYKSRFILNLESRATSFLERISAWIQSDEKRIMLFSYSPTKLFFLALGVLATPLVVSLLIFWITTTMAIIKGGVNIEWPKFALETGFMLLSLYSWTILLTTLKNEKDSIVLPQEENHPCIQEIYLPSNIRDLYKTDKEVNEQKSALSAAMSEERNKLTISYNKVLTILNTMYKIAPSIINSYQAMDQELLDLEKAKMRGLADEIEEEDNRQRKLEVEKLRNAMQNKNPTDVTDIDLLNKLH